MGLLTIKLGVDSGYEWKIPKTPAEIIALAITYIEFETTRRTNAPSLELIREALDRAQKGHTAAQSQELNRAEAANVFHRTLDQATPLLKEAFNQLVWKYRDTLARLERWGLLTKIGARGKLLVTKPQKETGWAAFLQTYVTQEASLPEADRITNPPLATLQALAATARTADVDRVSAQHTRETGVATRLAGAGPLLDLLQLACGMLVATQFDGQVTPALQDWGFNIIQTPARTPEPPTPIEPAA